MDYCEDMLNYLCLAIETNKNEMLNRIFEEITENCNEIFALAGVSNIEIDASYGHDSFLIETEDQSRLIEHFLKRVVKEQ